MNPKLAMQEFEEGIKLLQAKCAEQALPHIERAFHMDSENPYYVSYMGLAMGVARKKYGDAEVLCQKALKLRWNHPVFYLNLAEVYRRAGRRDDAVSALERGLLNTGNSPLLKNALGKLTQRQRPLIPFLRRNHKVNRKLGELKRQVGAFLTGA